jgi:lysosomal Pro-X carboxypeptidase
LRSSAAKLLPAIREAISVLYNVTGTQRCFDLPDYPTATAPMDTPNDGVWDWQWCTQQLPDSFWFGTSGDRDMFWPDPFNQSLVDEHCELTWGVKPRSEWIVQEYGGRRLGRGHTNIVFTSGGFDPQSSMCIANNLSESLTALLIPKGGHHLDLMFSHEADPEGVRAVRKRQMREIERWISEFGTEPMAKNWGDDL